MVRPLEGRRALVTGAAGGIGSAACRGIGDGRSEGRRPRSRRNSR